LKWQKWMHTWICFITLFTNQERKRYLNCLRGN